MAVHTYYLIRHGQYPPGDTADELGNGLTELGHFQAQKTAETFKDLPIKAIHCSTLRRAVETAEIIATQFPNLSVQAARDLWEFIPSIPPKFADFFAKQLPDVTSETIDRDRKVGDAAYDRLFRVPAESETSDTHEIIVAHGNLISYYVCRALALPTDVWIQMDTHNCGITRISIGATGLVKLGSFNDYGHLPPELRTL